MENKDIFVCPNCGAVRINWGKDIERNGFIEHIGFCRQCDTEFIVTRKREQKEKGLLSE